MAPTLREMFDEWFMSLPVERRPMRDSPASDLLVDAWIAGFAKHNEITCAAQRPRSKKQKIEDALRQSDLTAVLTGRNDIEWGHHESLPRGEHVANVRKTEERK